MRVSLTKEFKELPKFFDELFTVAIVMLLGTGKYQGSQIWINRRKRHLHRAGDKPARILQNGIQEWWVDGKLHRDGDKPARIDPKGTQEWYQEGKLHRDGDLPARIDHSLGDCDWYWEGVRHRTGGPACIRISLRSPCEGDEAWYHQGELHRTGGPAFESFLDYDRDLYGGQDVCVQRWYHEGEIHNLTGPAEIKFYPDPQNNYFLDGEWVDFEDWVQDCRVIAAAPDPEDFLRFM